MGQERIYTLFVKTEVNILVCGLECYWLPNLTFLVNYVLCAFHVVQVPAAEYNCREESLRWCDQLIPLSSYLYSAFNTIAKLLKFWVVLTEFEISHVLNGIKFGSIGLLLFVRNQQQLLKLPQQKIPWELMVQIKRSLFLATIELNYMGSKINKLFLSH